MGTLISEREWRFESLGYHIDISHLQSCVRAAATLEDPETVNKAIQMCDYGRRLGRDYQVTERPPFEDFYNDYRIMLRALSGEGVDGAIRYYTSKMERTDPDEDGNNFPAEVLTFLLAQVGRPEDAIAVYIEHLKAAPGPLSVCPSLLQLSALAGDYSQLLETAREKDDLLQFGLGLVKRAASSEPKS